MKKQDVVELMRDMPEEIDLEELMYRLYLKSRIEQGEAALAAGDTISHAEALRIFASWRK